MTSLAADGGWRRSNLGHLLFVATGRCVSEALRVAHEGGFSGVTEAQLALFGHLDPDGTRLTTLAARTDVTKQSITELIDRALRAGLVVRLPDPGDARARVVIPTERGQLLLRLARRGGAAATRLITAELDVGRRDALRRDLAAYTGRVAPLDQLLTAAARAFVRDVLTAVHPHGYAEVTESLLSLFRHLDLDGSRLTEVAANARITKQSMLGLVRRAEALGLVERAIDAEDRRARIICFTSDGFVMLERFRSGVEAAERRFVERTGAALPAVRETLMALADDHAGPRMIPSSNSAG